jgi:hypothetical protein
MFSLRLTCMAKIISNPRSSPKSNLFSLGVADILAGFIGIGLMYVLCRRVQPKKLS